MVQSIPKVSTHPIVKAAILYLSSQCDGASSIDGHGFNKVDASFGSGLAKDLNRGVELSLNQQMAACEMLQKYTRQLKTVDLELPTLFELSEFLIIPPPTEPELITTHAGFTLNQQQSDAIRKLEAWWSDRNSKFFCLKGYAGTGKTTTIQEFLSRVQQQHRGIYICVCAPTNKAVKVLERMAYSWGLQNIDTATIYQLLAMKIEFNDDGQEIVVADSTKAESLNHYDLVICDEASMIPEKIWSLLSGRTQCPKCVFMGDPAQLPPVGERESKVFSIPTNITLTQVMRYGNVIGEIVDSVRDNLDSAELFLPATCLDDKRAGIEILDKFQWLDKLVADFKSEAYEDNPDYCRVLAWTNEAVSWLNAYIRRGLHGDRAPQFVVGERLVANRPVVTYLDGKTEVLLNNSSECTILAITPGREIQGFDCWSLRVENELGTTFRVYCLDDGSKSALNLKLESLKADALSCPSKSYERNLAWKRYFALRDTFAYLTHCYALTIHKSQGSTFQNVYVALSDILKNSKIQERNQLIYVAYSRAAQRLAIAQ